MNAYDKNYLEQARTSLGTMIDYAIYDAGYDLIGFWEKFLTSPVSRRFEMGDTSILAGKSGIELALMVGGKSSQYDKPRSSEGKTPEYWLGWAIAYYQWVSGLSFFQITEFISIDEILKMYSPYHEMDIRQFCDKMDELYNSRKKETNLKKKRIATGLSQSRLSDITGIPVRTIQQYEQRQKDINKARAEYVIALSKALYCDPQQLLELQ